MSAPAHDPLRRSSKLDAILSRHAVITDRLAAGPDGETFVALSRELAELDPVVAR